MTKRSTDSLILNFDGADTLRRELDAALAPIAERYGVQLVLGRMTCERDGSGLSVKLTASRIVDGVTMTPEANAFKQLADAYGMDPDWLGAEFDWRGERYRVTGLNTRARKMPIVAERVRDGAGYKFPEATIIRALKAPA